MRLLGAASAVLLLAAAPTPIYGHGNLVSPRPRNSAAGQANGYCPHCGFGGSKQTPGSLCGDGGTWSSKDHYMTQVEDQPVAEYQAGDVAEFELYITAYHKGHFEFHLCNRPVTTNSDISCLQKRPLHRVRPSDCPVSDAVCRANGDCRPSCQPLDPNYPGRWYVDKSMFQQGRVKLMYKIPVGLACDKCTIQWFYSTANSNTRDPSSYACFRGALAAAGYAEFDTCSNCNAQCSESNDPGSTGVPRSPEPAQNSPLEEFRNCADVRVIGSGGTASSTSVLTSTAYSTATVTTATASSDSVSTSSSSSTPFLTSSTATATTPAPPATNPAPSQPPLWECDQGHTMWCHPTCKTKYVECVHGAPMVRPVAPGTWCQDNQGMGVTQVHAGQGSPGQGCEGGGASGDAATKPATTQTPLWGCDQGHTMWCQPTCKTTYVECVHGAPMVRPVAPGTWCEDKEGMGITQVHAGQGSPGQGCEGGGASGAAQAAEDTSACAPGKIWCDAACNSAYLQCVHGEPVTMPVAPGIRCEDKPGGGISLVNAGARSPGQGCGSNGVSSTTEAAAAESAPAASTTTAQVVSLQAGLDISGGESSDGINHASKSRLAASFCVVALATFRGTSP